MLKTCKKCFYRRISLFLGTGACQLSQKAAKFLHKSILCLSTIAKRYTTKFIYIVMYVYKNICEATLTIVLLIKILPWMSTGWRFSSAEVNQEESF